MQWADTLEWKTSLQLTTLYANLELFFPHMHYFTICTLRFLPAINFTKQSPTNVRSFSAICLGFSEILLCNLFWFQLLEQPVKSCNLFSIFLSQIICNICYPRYPSSTHILWATPLAPYTVKTVYLLLPFVSYPLANYLSIETLTPYLMTAKFFQQPLVRDLLNAFSNQSR